MSSYPEYEVNRKLFVKIHTNLEPDKAVEKLQEFDQKWLLKHIKAIKGNLNFDVKIVEDRK